MKKKSIALLLCGLLLFCMTACTGNGTSQEGKGSNLSDSGVNGENGGAVLSSSQPAEPLTKEEMAEIIRGARTDAVNESMPIFTSAEEPMEKMVLEVLGLEESDLEAYALSVSLINIRAYGVGMLRPAPESAQKVADGVNAFVAAQQAAFENYLPDQRAIANGAITETLDDGTVLLVMCEGETEVYRNILAGLEGKAQE